MCHVYIYDKLVNRYDTCPAERWAARSKLFLRVSWTDDEGHSGKRVPRVWYSRRSHVWHEAWYDSQHTYSRVDGDTWHRTPGITDSATNHYTAQSSFLLRDAMHMHDLCCPVVSVLPSILLSVYLSRSYSIETNKHSFKIFSPSCSDAIIVFYTKRYGNIPVGTP